MGKTMKAETTRELEAYKYYYGLYPRRSLAEVSKKFGVSDVTVGKWAKKYHWEERIALQMEEEEKQWRISLAKSKVLADQKHLKIANVMQSKGLEALTGGGKLEQKDGAEVLKKGVDMERDILGTGKEEEKAADKPVAVNQNIMAVIINEVINGDKKTVMRAVTGAIRKLKSSRRGKDTTA
jgi:hypothetical protein